MLSSDIWMRPTSGQVVFGLSNNPDFKFPILHVSDWPDTVLLGRKW